MEADDRRAILLTRQMLFAAIALLLMFWVGLVLESRPAWCKTGIGLWSAAWTNCTSQHFLDPYSLSHVLHGIIFYWILRLAFPRLALHWRLIGALALEIGWELLENSQFAIDRYRKDTASFDYAGDSILNSMGDVLVTPLGFWFAARFSWKAALVLFVIFELWMLYLARDNLTLNVLMLLYPIDAIKHWQWQAVP